MHLNRSQFLVAAGPDRHPKADAIAMASHDLAARLGLLDEGNRRRFAAFNRLVPYVYPRADPPRAVTCAAWCNWLFFFDDVHDEDMGAAADVDHVSEVMSHHLRLLRGERAEGPLDPLSRLTLDFRARALDLAGEAWLRRFIESAHAYLVRGVLPAVRHWNEGRPPALAAYLEQREHDGAVHTALDLIELASGEILDEAIAASAPVARLRRACARTVAYFNDIVSYPKEVLEHRNPNNLIAALMAERRTTFAEAMAEAVQIVNDEARAMLDAAAALRGEAASSAALAAVVEGAKRWQRGNIDWSLAEARYASHHSAFAELRA